MDRTPAAGGDAGRAKARGARRVRLLGPAARCGLALLGALLTGWAASAAEPVGIEVPVFEGGEGLTFFLDCARAYEKERSGVRVNLYGDPRIADKLRVRILEGTFPEISNAPVNYEALIAKGEILPLDRFLDGPNWEGDMTWRESFLPGSLDPYTYGGRAYAIPLPYFVSAVWYNRKMFREHGWTLPRMWDEFFALCEQIKAAGIAPVAFQGRYTGYAQRLIDPAYFHLAGRERYYQQLRLTPGAFDNPEMVEALRLTQHTALNYFQPGNRGMSHTEAQMQFFLGRTAMVICAAWLKSEMMGKIPPDFELGQFPLPVPARGVADPQSLHVKFGYYLVFKNSPHPEEAVDFLRFMTSRRMAGLFCRQRDIPVAVRGVNEGNLSSDLRELAAIIEASRGAFGPLPGGVLPEMEQCWNNVREALLAGKMTPEEASKALEAGAALIREQASHPDRITVRHPWKAAALLGALGAGITYWLVLLLRTVFGRRRPAQEWSGGLRTDWKRIVLFLAPATVLYTAFVIVPCVRSFAWCTVRWDGLTEKQPVGLLHFRRLLLESDGFWIALGNNLFIMLVVPAFVLPLSLFLAACISRRVWGHRLFRIAFFFPNILGGVAATLLWMYMYNPQGGPVNAALAGVGEALNAVGLDFLGRVFVGFRDFAWLAQENLYWALVPMFVWAGCGFNMVLFLAAMERIPPSLYEAAELDGAPRWTQFWRITLPLIWDVLAIAVVFMLIGGMKTFETIWLMTNQWPSEKTHVIGTLMVQSMFTEFKVGQATAIAVLLFLMALVGSAAALRLMRRERVEF